MDGSDFHGGKHGVALHEITSHMTDSKMGPIKVLTSCADSSHTNTYARVT